MKFPDFDDFDKLSLEQLKQLLQELGPYPVLLKELNARLLMGKVEGMGRALACLLTDANEDPWTEGKDDVRAEQLAALFVRNRFTQTQLTNLRLQCAPGGQKVWNRACRRYFNDPFYQARTASGQEVLDYVMSQQSVGSDKGESDSSDKDDEPNFDGEAAAADAEEFSDDFEDAEEARTWLRDALGITSARDWEMMLDALQCIAKVDPVAFHKPGLTARNQVTKRALRLLETARAQGCSPSRWMAWQEQRQLIMDKKANPNAIFIRPDGQAIYGDGSPVLRDKHGNPRRRVETIFGTPMPEGSVPDHEEIKRAVKRGFGTRR